MELDACSGVENRSDVVRPSIRTQQVSQRVNPADLEPEQEVGINRLKRQPVLAGSIYDSVI